MALERWALSPWAMRIPSALYQTAYLSPIQIEARAVFAIVLCQETGVVRLILFEVGADDEAAVLVVGADTQRLVDHLLGQRRVRKDGWLAAALRPGWLLKRRKIKEGTSAGPPGSGSLGCPSE